MDTWKTWGVAFGIVVMAPACGHTQRLEQVRELPGVSAGQASAPRGWNGASVVIETFHDDRPEEFYRARHNRIKVEHPEFARAFDDKHVSRVGELEEEIPALLAIAMPPGATVRTDGAPASGTFSVQGKVLQSTLESRFSTALAFPGLVGIPWGFHRYRFRFAISVMAPEPGRSPLWTKTYEFERKGIEGFYYGHSRSGDLAKAGLRETIALAAVDIARVVGQARASAG